MTYSLTVENIKCGGCANTIRTRVSELEAVGDVNVDVEAGRIDVTADESTRGAVVSLLLKLGYPETGAVHGLGSATAKAKSFVSCAVGRIDNMKSDKGETQPDTSAPGDPEPKA